MRDSEYIRFDALMSRWVLALPTESWGVFISMKYMGGKARIVDKILPIMLENSDCSCFVDMFCGGCSVI